MLPFHKESAEAIMFSKLEDFMQSRTDVGGGGGWQVGGKGRMTENVPHKILLEENP